MWWCIPFFMLIGECKYKTVRITFLWTSKSLIKFFKLIIPLVNFLFICVLFSHGGLALFSQESLQANNSSLRHCLDIACDISFNFTAANSLINLFETWAYVSEIWSCWWSDSFFDCSFVGFYVCEIWVSSWFAWDSPLPRLIFSFILGGIFRVSLDMLIFVCTIFCRCDCTRCCSKTPMLLLKSNF